MRRIAPLVAAIAVLAGCGDKLDSGSIEQDARDAYKSAGVTVKDVDCPDSGKTGDTINCEVTFDDGTKVKLPYHVAEDAVEATDETVQVINETAAKHQPKPKQK
jgi:hypothetical protein